MRSIARDLAILALVGGVVLFSNLGGPRLWDRDEPRNAGCALEMRERGDWITPWFNDELRSHKPVLLYWLIMSAYAVFGVSEFSARFWSAALGLGSVWLTYAMGRRLFSPRVGLWAGVILCSTLMFDVAARAATPDSVLLFCVTLAITLFVCGEFPRRSVAVGGAGASPQGELAAASLDEAGDQLLGGRGWNVPLRISTAIGTYAAMGLAVLAKGPVGAVLPTAVVGMFLLVARLRQPATEVSSSESHSSETGESTAVLGWGRRLWGWGRAALRPFAPLHFLKTCWDMRPLLAIAMILAVAGPWYVWVGIRTDGQFLRGFFWEHNVARAVQSFEGHRGGPWFYPVAICIGFFPWSVFASPWAVDLKRRWRLLGADAGGVVFALCWAGVWIGVFSLARTKLPSYVTPAYPALALLTADFVARWSEGRIAVGRWLARVPLIVFGLTGAVLLFALPLVARRFLPGAEWLAVLGLAPIAGSAVAWWWWRQEQFKYAAGAFATAAVAFSTLLLGVAPQVVDRYQQADRLLAAIDQFDSQAEVAALGGLEPSWVFYGRRPIRELTLDQSAFIPGGLSSTAQVTDATVASPYLPKPFVPVNQFLEEDEHRVVIVHGRQLPELQQRYGERLAVLAEAPKFLRKDRLYVVTLHGERSARELRATKVQ
ncbi:MAG: glycosyltransferase family 39 protein [Pirellulales bacterium]